MAFLRVARGEIASPCTARDALEAMRISVAADRSRSRASSGPPRRESAERDDQLKGGVRADQSHVTTGRTTISGPTSIIRRGGPMKRPQEVVRIAHRHGALSSRMRDTSPAAAGHDQAHDRRAPGRRGRGLKALAPMYTEADRRRDRDRREPLRRPVREARHDLQGERRDVRPGHDRRSVDAEVRHRWLLPGPDQFGIERDPDIAADRLGCRHVAAAARRRAAQREGQACAAARRDGRRQRRDVHEPK